MNKTCKTFTTPAEAAAFMMGFALGAHSSTMDLECWIDPEEPQTILADLSDEAEAVWLEQCRQFEATTSTVYLTTTAGVKITAAYIERTLAEALRERCNTFSVEPGDVYSLTATKAGQEFSIYATPFWKGLTIPIASCAPGSGDEQSLVEIPADFFTGNPTEDAPQYLQRVAAAIAPFGFTLKC